MGKTKRPKVHLLWLVPFVPLILAGGKMLTKNKRLFLRVGIATAFVMFWVWVATVSVHRTSPQQRVPLSQMQSSIQTVLNYQYETFHPRTKEGDAEALGYLRMIKTMDQKTFNAAVKNFSAEDRKVIRALMQKEK